jgi:IS4 transposase
MRFLAERINATIGQVNSTGFKAIARKVEGAFTRSRKLPLFALVLTLLERRGLTLSMEILGFKEKAIVEDTFSQTAYSNARQKLNSESIAKLYKDYNRDVYAAEEMPTFKDYLLLASDGSSVNVPTTPETVKKYGSSSRKGVKPQATLGLSALHDVLGRVILTASCNRGKFNEAVQSENHLNELPGLIGDRKNIIIEDRGYPSLPHLARLNNAGQKFVIRLKSTDFKAEQRAMQSDDEVVDIKIDKSRLQHYVGASEHDLLTGCGGLTLRFVKIPLSNNTIECLVTNLSDHEFTTADIGFIYHQRWGIETAFEILKNKLQCENFTGIIPDLIEQDIYASVFVFNLSMHLVADAEAARETETDIGKKNETSNGGKP